MERDFTRAALDTDLGQRADLEPLAGKLAEGVDRYLPDKVGGKAGFMYVRVVGG